MSLKEVPTGDGYSFAQDLEVIPLRSYSLPKFQFTSAEPFIKSNRLKGLSLKDVELSVLKKNAKKRISHQMDMLFTHFGISGPAALRCSQFVYKEQKNQKTQHISMEIDQFPNQTMNN